MRGYELRSTGVRMQWGEMAEEIVGRKLRVMDKGSQDDSQSS